MNKISPEEFRSSILKIKNLYSTPLVLSKAVRLLQNTNANLDPIVGLIRNDPALSVDLLRISNSALYSRGRICADLESAVQRLGVREVLRVIALSLGKNIFGKGLTNYGVSADEYWSSSVLAAVLMESLSDRLGFEAPDAYMTGMLHGMGRVVINQMLEDIGWSWFEDTSKPLEFWEVDTVGFTHAGAGAIVLKEWGFPPELCEAINTQLDPATESNIKTLTGMLRFTVHLIYDLKALDMEEGEDLTATEEFCAWSGFPDVPTLTAFAFEANGKLEKVRAALKS